MRIAKYIFLSFFILLLLIVGYLYYYVGGIKPQYEGDLVLSGLDKQVEVYFDNYGVPHIDASTDKDAFRALGYLHAQERLWQMEVMRRIAPGRLSEIFGSKLLETDKFFKTLGIYQYSEKSAEALIANDGEILQLVEAYVSGINEFQTNGANPIEFTLLGIEKAPYEIKDIFNITGYMSFSFANAFKADPVVTAITQLGEDYWNAFDHGEGMEIMKNYKNTEAAITMSANVNQMMKSLPMPAFIGSNSWVIAPDRSATGSVMLCNDPHIGFSQPAVWYEAHIKSPGFNYFGYHLAGVPFGLLIHNEYIATGLTMFENDDMDFYQEKINPENSNEYWAIDHWEKFESRKEKIIVKDSTDVEFEVKTTRHGPIINEVTETMNSDQPIAVWWTFYEFPNRLLEAIYDITKSKSIMEVRNAGEKIHAPGLNLMYGDNNGNIAWWAVGKLVKRPGHVNSKTILDGSSGIDDPLGYYDYTENPGSENPPDGFVYSANNQSVMNIPDTTILYPGYYLPGSRAKRIVDLLEGDKKLTKDDMKAMFLDNESPLANGVIDVFADIINDTSLSEYEKEALEVFKSWDGKHHDNSEGAAIFYALVINMYHEALYDEFEQQFGVDLAKEYMSSFMNTYLMKRSIPKFLRAKDSPWWDYLPTKERETREDVITVAFKSSVSYMQERFGNDMKEWKWSDVHTVEHPHALGSVAMLRSIFNVGPFPIAGSDMAINCNGFPYTAEKLFDVSYGPSTRRLIDFSNINDSESILPTGQSGVPFSDHYDDQAEMFISGKWRKLNLSIDQIKNQSTVLTIRPE